MNRLSIINGGLPIQKQNIKQAAYFDYLKSFSEGGLQTLERLEKQFNKYVNKSDDSEESKLFKKIKTLISAYQVFVIQMNDSCEFIEVPQFGSCILKVFIQLIAILKWSLKLIEQNKKEEVQKPQVKVLSAKRQSNMRMTFNGNFSQTLKQSNRCSQCLKNDTSTPRNMFKLKQQTTLHLRDIGEQIKRINIQYAEAQKNAKVHQQEEWALKKFIEKRDEKNNPNYSKNQEVLTEILAALNRKGQNIARFADLRLNCLNQINKSQSNEEQYQKFNKQISQQMVLKVEAAKLKLKQLFKQHIEQYQKQKMQNRVQIGIQINEQDSSKMNKIHEAKMIKKLKGDIKKLQKDLEYERNMIACLKQLLEDKSVEYETQIMKYRTQFVCFQLKSRRELRSQKSVQNQNPAENNQNLSQNSGSKISIDFSQDNNTKQVRKISFLQKEQKQSKDQDSNIYQKQNKTSTKLKNRNKIKKSTKFKLDNTFYYDFQVFQQKYIPEDNKYQKIKFTCLSRKGSKIKTAFFGLDSYANADDEGFANQYQNKQTQTQLIQCKAVLKQKKMTGLSLQQNIDKTSQKIRTGLNAHKKNIVSYSKKRSSHMGLLVQKFQIQKNNENINYQQIQTNRSVTGLINIKTKQNNAQNDFVSLNICKNFIPKFQINKNLVFDDQDILTLFLTFQNAESFQWFSLQKQLTVSSSLLKKKGVHYSISAMDANWSYKKNLNNKSMKEKMVSYLLNQLKILKIKNKKIYQNLKGFLRFPYSYIKRIQGENNIMLYDQSNIQYTQMTKIISRILKMHQVCLNSQNFSQGQCVCHHIITFYEKIGIKLE